MAFATGGAIGVEVCEKFGLDPKLVKNLTINLPADGMATVTVELSTHWLAPEEQTQIIAAFNAGLLSNATAIASLGFVDDPDAELTLIEDEQKKDAALIPQPKISDPKSTIDPGDPNAD